MAKAKLLSALAFDAEQFEASGLADPTIRVQGELPATSQPFNLNRVYKGPQGQVEESILLVDPDNRVLWQRPYRLIELRGEMYEDLFRSTVKDRVVIERGGPHGVVFLINGAEVGRIPVFIDASQSAAAVGALGEAMEKSLQKGSIVWLTIPQANGGSATRPAWYVQQGTKLFVVKGGDEQELPNLEHVEQIEVTVRSKDVNAAIGTVTATTRIVAADDAEFDRIANLGMGTRLNLSDGEGALARWKQTCTMVELTLQA